MQKNNINQKSRKTKKKTRKTKKKQILQNPRKTGKEEQTKTNNLTIKKEVQKIKTRQKNSRKLKKTQIRSK